MAKLTLVKNIFDLKDAEVFDIKEIMTVQEFIDSQNLIEGDYSCMAEVYDPDTEETSWVNLEDNKESLHIAVQCNGKQVGLDYVMNPSDEVVIQILPASKTAVGTTLAGAGFLSWASAVLLLTFLTVASPWVVGGLMLAGVALAVGGGILAASDNGDDDGKSKTLNDSNIPTVNGSQNQALIGNAFPLVVGKTYCTPFVVGSPYIEYDRSPTFDESWLGTKQKMKMLLCLGYAPLLVKDICLDQLPLAKNPNNVLSGVMSYMTDGKGLVDENGNPVTFNENRLASEIGQSWASNKIKVEISQLGHERQIYHDTVNYEPMKEALLYCYDKMYQEVATEANLVTWQGGKYPVGLRTNTIHFTRSVPYKIQVGINFPAGLYRTRSVDGDNEYTKIPMNLAVQWRPYYKYVKENEEKIDTPCPIAYNNKSPNPSYNEGRYGKWRNFDDDAIVPKIHYSSDKVCYNYQFGNYPFVYEKAGKLFYAKLTMTRDYTLSEEIDLRGATENNLVHIDRIGWAANVETMYRRYTEKEIYNKLYDFASKYYGTLAKEKEDRRHTILIGGVACTYSATWWWGIHEFKETPEDFAKEHSQEMYLAQDQRILDDYPNEVYEGKTSKRECNLNKGLSKDTDTSCNPTWSGVEAFSFGCYSGGADMYRKNPDDPSLTDNEITYKEYKDGIETAKNEMQFELTATLTQEDILDLINRNPRSIEVGKETGNIALHDLTDVVFDSIEVRVVRLTPCYIDKSDDNNSWTYCDVVKWNYIKSFTIDRGKLLDDIDYCQEGKDFAKINCNPLTWSGYDTTDPEHPVDIRNKMKQQGSLMYNAWNIEDYISKPLTDEDSDKMVTIGFEVYPDKLGNLTGNMDKINCTALAITPALLQNYVRYWYRGNEGGYFYCDTYNKPDSVDLTKIDMFTPLFEDETRRWTSSTKEEFDSESPVRIGSSSYWYSVKDKDWERQFFPAKVEEKFGPEYHSDYTGRVIYNPDGTPVVTTVKVGSTWLDQIKAEANRYQDSLGRCIATDSFVNSFTGQNAIAQVLGVMVGGSLGKDAYTYNSLPWTRLVRLWRDGEDGYEFADTDEPTLETAASRMSFYKFQKCSRDFFAKENPVEFKSGLYWSWRKAEGSFNMLALKEAYVYTNNIDMGGGNNACQYNCNMYIYQQQKVQDLLKTILSAARAFWFYDDRGRIEIHNDRPLNNPVLLLTDENVISSSNQRIFKKGIAGYHITFNDENNNGEPGEIYVLRQGQTRERHTRDIKDLQLTGVTNNIQARGLGLYMLAQSIVQREIWTKKLNHIGSVLTIGSLVRMQSSTLEIGTDSSGRVERLIEGVEVVDGNEIPFVYGFILDNMYQYRDEYNEDGSNVQGCSIMQASKGDANRIVTLRFANREQQAKGMNVGGVVYRNYKAMTNLVLFEKKIRKDTGEVETLGDGISAITEFNIKPGDVVAFGNMGSITSDTVVCSITPDEKNHYSVGFYLYYPEVFTAGNMFPSYDANITKKPLVDAPLATDIDVTTEIRDASQKAYSDANARIDSTKTELQAEIDAIETNAVRIWCSNPSLLFHKKADGKSNEEHTEVNFRLMVNEVATKCESIEVDITGAKGVVYDIKDYDDTTKTYTVDIKSRYGGTAPEGFVTVTLSWNEGKYTQDILLESTAEVNYLGGLKYDEIPNPAIINSFFVYQGEENEGFIPSYVYICEQKLNDDGEVSTVWSVDESVDHMMTAMTDIVACTEISEETKAYEFIGRLVANNAFIQNLFAQKIEVGNLIQSANYEPFKIQGGYITEIGKGFKLGNDGIAELNEISINGIKIQHQAFGLYHGVNIGYDNCRDGIGSGCVVIGALNSYSSGGQSVVIGTNSMNNTGFFNVGIGYRTGLTAGNYNTILGAQAFWGCHDSTKEGPAGYLTEECTIIGYDSFSAEKTSKSCFNTTLGSKTLLKLKDGENNIAIGYKSASESRYVSNSITIGNFTETPSDSIVIGNNIVKTGTPIKGDSIYIGNNISDSESDTEAELNAIINIGNVLKYSTFKGNQFFVKGEVLSNGVKLSTVKNNSKAVSSVNFKVDGYTLYITTAS